MSPRKWGCYLRDTLGGAAAKRRVPTPAVTTPVEDVIAGPDTPLALARLLVGRSNDEREAAVRHYLTVRRVPFATHRFQTFVGQSENFSVELGAGDRVLVLIAHHDAVPDSPGANDNAAAVGILLHLVWRLAVRVPPGLRVRLLFTGGEEVGSLGARAWVRDSPLADIVGVLSLELCGIGDCVAVWDADDETSFLRRVRGALETVGLRRNEGQHVVGYARGFSSDHRAFAAAGLPAYGFTAVPCGEVGALRRLVATPGSAEVLNLVQRPRPFDTYHTPADGLATLEPAALALVTRAVETIVETV